MTELLLFVILFCSPVLFCSCACSVRHVPFVILEQDVETPRLAKASVAAVQPESPPDVVTMKAVLMLALKPGVHDVSLVVDVVVEVVTLVVVTLVVVVVVELAGDEYETTADSTPSTADRRLVSNRADVVCSLLYVAEVATLWVVLHTSSVAVTSVLNA